MGNPFRTDKNAVKGYVESDRMAGDKSRPREDRVRSLEVRKSFGDTMNHKTQQAAQKAVTEDRKNRS